MLRVNRVMPAVGTLLVTALSLGLASAQPIADQTPAGQESGVDAAIKPGDDFFAYANGAWLKATEIPVGKDRVSARTEFDALTRAQIAKLLDDASAAPAGTTARKVADFRTAYLNEAAIEADGVAPLKPQFDGIDRVQDKAALTRLLGSELRADADPLNWGIYNSAHLLGLAVEEGTNGEKTNVAILVQGGLGLPDRDRYLGAEPRMQTLRTAYTAYIAAMLAQAGFDNANRRADAVMALETAIAQSHATREASANDRNADNLWTRADFARKAPGMDWPAFFTAAGLSKQNAFVVWQPGAVTGAAALVASQPLDAWKDYLRFHAIDRYADVLPRAFADRAAALHDEATGQPQPISRAQRAVDATQAAMSEALGRLYVEHYFPPEQKARVQAIVANVLAAFRRRVEAVTWMSPATRTVALAKLKTLYLGMGYPEKWQDYSDLAIDPADPVGNLRRIADRNTRQALARLGKPVDTTQWWMAPQTVGGVLLFQLNAYNFPAALLQAPKFDAAGSDAANYGAIGAIIGHEITHLVDTLGAQYEPDGANRGWWTPEDKARYQTSTEPLVNQFSAYRPFPDIAINGKLTLVENLADLGGLAASFDAYRGTLGDKAADKDYVHRHDRQFFIAFARGWRAKIRDDALRTQVQSNDHAPESYRVATVRNMDAWYEAFDVMPGQKLYLEPKARVRVW